ncbi:MAG: hypothetical protein ABIT47_04035 [Candidatus Paceibacterota bacterium]
MPRPHDDAIEQMQERITNVLVVLNKYRAQNLEDARIESIMTQLERVQEKMDEKEHFTHREIQDLDFSLTEGSPIENNESLGRELYSIRNFIDNLP